MDWPKPETRTIDIMDPQEHWEPLLDQVATGRAHVVLQRNGAPVGAIISPAEWERFKQYEAKRDADFAGLSRTGHAFEDVPVEELQAEIAKVVAEAHEDMRRDANVRQERMRTEGRRVLEASWRAFADVPPEEIEQCVAEAVTAALEELRHMRRT